MGKKPSVPKKHHLVPQAYLSAWADNRENLEVKDKETGGIQRHKKESIFCRRNYYSISVGMPICTSEDAESILEPLEDYNVIYKGQNVTAPIDLLRIYYDFDEWEIRKDGIAISMSTRNSIKDRIKNAKVLKIEEAWSDQYENSWPTVRAEIVNTVTKGDGDIPEFQKSFLVRFFVMLNWREFSKAEEYKEDVNLLWEPVRSLYDNAEDDDDEPGGIKPIIDDYVKASLLKRYWEFLNKNGHLYEQAMQDLEHTSILFCIAGRDLRFVTSDNPAFYHKTEEGRCEGIMPVTPKILLILRRQAEQESVYHVLHINDAMIAQYNDIIEEHATESIILDNSRDTLPE